MFAAIAQLWQAVLEICLAVTTVARTVRKGAEYGEIVVDTSIAEAQRDAAKAAEALAE